VENKNNLKKSRQCISDICSNIVPLDLYEKGKWTGKNFVDEAGNKIYEMKIASSNATPKSKNKGQSPEIFVVKCRRTIS
tara:strand:+ start:496 stop:732 length:237 start_codon:yes stop_codon:yes gene_type:complete